MANKLLLWYCFSSFFIIVISHTSSASAFEFERKSYVFVVSRDHGEGVIGQVQVQPASPNVEFSFVGSSSPLEVNKDTGEVRLTKTLGSNMEMTNEFTLQAKERHSETETTTTAYLIVLPDDLVSAFAQQALHQEKVERMSAPTQSSAENSEDTSTNLFRQFRHLPSDFRADSRAQVMAERVVARTKSKVGQFFADTYPDAKIVNLVSVKTSLPKEKCKKKIHAICPLITSKYRTINGSCNNVAHPDYGASHTPLIRLRQAKYYDAHDLNDPIGYPGQPEHPNIPSPLDVSSDFIIDEVRVNAMELSSKFTHALMQFGQFLDHDMTLVTDAVDDGKCKKKKANCDPNKPIKVPCYPIRKPKDSEAKCILLTRSTAVCQPKDEQRQQLNVNAAFVDLSQVYGSSYELSNKLRDLTGGVGLLKARPRPHGDVLPKDTIHDMECAGEDGCYLAGDIRVNEQAALACFQTLFFREHNRIARELKIINNHWDGETIYQETRHILGGVMQKITYDDYLPKILGYRISEYTRYDERVNPGISNAFATAAFRFGHSQIRPAFDIVKNDIDSIYEPVDLRYMFFNNSIIVKHGISPLLLGLAADNVQKVDRALASGVVDHLFAKHGKGGMNLAAINIQRSRDHGLPGYNAFRNFCNLPSARTFDDTANEIKNAENRRILSILYHDNPDNVELWVAGLAETPVAGGSVGPTFQCIIKDQFERTRDGDRYFYESDGVFNGEKFVEIIKGSLARMYCDNLNIGKIQPDVFDATQEKVDCPAIDGIDLSKWKENENREDL